MLVFQR